MFTDEIKNKRESQSKHIVFLTALPSSVSIGRRCFILLLLIIIIGGCESFIPHPRPWTKREKIAATFFIAAHTANALSTEKHQDRPDLYYERNSLMGRHPTDTEIGVYFSVTGILTLLIADWYPELREPLLYGYGGLNLGLTIDDTIMVQE